MYVCGKGGGGRDNVSLENKVATYMIVWISLKWLFKEVSVVTCKSKTWFQLGKMSLNLHSPQVYICVSINLLTRATILTDLVSAC